MAGSMRQAGTDGKREGGFLTRLGRDARGMTLAMMAAFLIPLTALAGSTIDLARMYVVKSRLQQACDAGVLAGRKFMNDTTTNPVLDDTAKQRANEFFNNNFKAGWMGTSEVAFTPSKTSDNQVLGNARADVPMTIMSMFGFLDNTITVVCKARFDVADTDVMFVLDTTASMACLPSDSDTACSNYASGAARTPYTRPGGSGVAGYGGTTGYATAEKTGSRIEALRLAVLSFYDAFDAAADPSTKVRYGFVTYSSVVNSGKAILDISSSYLVGSQGLNDTADYQSRRVYADYQAKVTDTINGKSEADCKSFKTTRSPSASLTYDTSSGSATEVSTIWSNGRCYTRTKTLVPQWEYRQLPFDVSAVLGGDVVTNPTKVRGQMMRWLGCVESLVETPGQTSFVTTSLPSELDPDLVPSGDTRWIPHMQDLIYIRNNSYTKPATDYTIVDDWTSNPGYGSDFTQSTGEDIQKGGAVACGKPVKRLGVMTRQAVRDFVYATDFKALGGTYHDTGMIWGTRLISPSGPWKSDTAAWPNHNAPNRVIVFLTDGDMAPTTSSYSMYGMEGYDRRVAKGDNGNLATYHNARFLAECAAAKARNIDVWTVSIDTSASAPMKSCATTNAQALYTTDGNDLSAKFAQIAKKLAMLRITQ